MRATLVLTQFDGAVDEGSRQRTLDAGRLMIGRGAENDWVLPDSTQDVSRWHCTIDFKDGVYSVTDLSTNGVFINEAPSPLGKGRSEVLHDGDRLSLGAHGRFQFAVRIEESRSAADASQPRVLDLLAREKSEGHVATYRGFWIVNVVVVRADREALLDVAALSEVAQVLPPLRMPAPRQVPVIINSFNRLDSLRRLVAWLIRAGQEKIFVDRIWPDMKFGPYPGPESSQVQITLHCVDYPTETPRTYGPYTMTEAKDFITTRLRARLIAIEVESDDVGSFWRLGLLRYRFQSDGKF